jgi:hypothetical protein
MPIEGFWIIKFTAAQIYGSGVAVFSDGKVYGGETGFYYLGTYEADGDVVKARVLIRNFDPTIPSGFGILGDYEMDVSAMLEGDTMTGDSGGHGSPRNTVSGFGWRGKPISEISPANLCGANK